MRPPWTRRAGVRPAVDYLVAAAMAINDANATMGEAFKAIGPPPEPSPNVAPLTDAKRADMWKRIAASYLDKLHHLKAENARLRADLNLARNLATGPVGCGHETTLRRYDHDRAVCQREHVEEIDRLNAQVARLRRQAGHGTAAEPTFQEIAAIKRRDDQ